MDSPFDLRPLRVRELFTRTARILREAPALVVACASLEVAVLEVLSYVTVTSPDWIVELRNLLVGVAALGGSHALLGGMVALVVSDLSTGRRAGFARLWREFTDHGVPMFVTGAFATVSVVIGLVLLLIPGVLASLRWIYAAPVMAVERRYGGAALRRSTELSQARAQSALLLLLASLTPEAILLWLPGESSVSWLVGLCASGAASAFLWTLIAVGYLDVRVRSEASFGGEVLADQLAGWPRGCDGASLDPGPGLG